MQDKDQTQHNTLFIPHHTKISKWREQEIQELLRLVDILGERWTSVAKHMPNKNSKQCMQKFKNMVKVKKRGNWNANEDQLLREWVQVHGPRKWTKCSRRIEGRCGKQCRERWMNNLDPTVKRGNWTEREQSLIFRQLKTNWSSWSRTAKRLQGRTENAIKNYFYSSVRRLKTGSWVRALEAMTFTPTGKDILYSKGHILFKRAEVQTFQIKVGTIKLKCHAKAFFLQNSKKSRNERLKFLDKKACLEI